MIKKTSIYEYGKAVNLLELILTGRKTYFKCRRHKRTGKMEEDLGNGRWGEVDKNYGKTFRRL